MINISIALYDEAKPIINYYKLKPKDFYFSNGDINLIVTKSSKILSAINTTKLLTLHKYPTINIGVAGSNKYQIGQGFLINKITDYETNKNFYPDNIINFKSYASLTTISKVGEYFEVVDMEGSGFFQACNEFLKVNEIFLYKIISDTPTQKNISKQKIHNLIEFHLDKIDNIISQINKKPDDFFEDIYRVLNSLNLTHSEYHKMKDYLIYLKLKNKPFPNIPNFKNKKQKSIFLNNLWSKI